MGKRQTYEEWARENIKPDFSQEQLSQALKALPTRDLMKLRRGLVALEDIGSFADGNIISTIDAILLLRRRS